MNCSQFRKNVSSYLDSELSFTETRDFKQHCEECPRCAELIADMVRIREILQESRSVSLSSDFVPRLQARLRTEINRSPAWWQHLLTPRFSGFSPVSLSGIAAATLALFIIGISLFQQESAPIVDPPAGAAQIETPAVMIPEPVGMSPAANPQLTTSPVDSSIDQRDSIRRDYSRQIRYVDQPQGR